MIKSSFLKLKTCIKEYGMTNCLIKSLDYLFFWGNKRRHTKEIDACSIQCDRVRVCIDYKRVRIFYGGEEITKAIGLNTAILSEGQWCDSTAAKFFIKKEKEDLLVIHTEWEKLPIRQTWSISLRPNKIMLCITMKVSRPLRIDRKNISLYLTKTMNEWYTETSKGEYPDNFGSQLQPLVNSDEPHCLVARSDLGIALDANIATNRYLLLQNADATFAARCLQVMDEENETVYKEGLYEDLELCLTFVGQGELSSSRQYYLEKIEEKLEQEKQQKAAAEKRRKWIEEEEKRAWADNHTLQDGDARIFIGDENRLQIFHSDIELTKAIGLGGHVLCEGQWVDLSNAEVRVEKRDKNSLMVYSQCNMAPIAYIWQISLEKNKIIMTASMDITQPIRIDRKCLNIFFSGKFTDWYTQTKSGQFEQITAYQWRRIAETSETKCLIVFDEVGVLASVDLASGRRILLQDTGMELNARCIQVEDNDNEKLYQKGTYPFIDISLEVLAGGQLTVAREYFIQQLKAEERRRKEAEAAEERRRKEAEAAEERRRRETAAEERRLWIESRTIKDGDARIFIDEESRVRLYYKEDELTKGCGFYTLLQIDGVWRDLLALSRTDVQKINNKKIIVSIKNDAYSFTQIWAITLEGNTVNWQAGVLADAKVIFDGIKQEICFSSKYNQWFNSCGAGILKGWSPKLTELFSINCVGCDLMALSDKEDILPSLIWRLDGQKQINPFIRVTDINLSSHVLGVEGVMGLDLLPQHEEWLLTAKIELVPDKERFNKFIKEAQEKWREARTIWSKDERLSLYLDDGKARIYWDDTELTKQAAMTTGFYCQNNWHNSEQAITTCRKKASSQFIVEKNWHNLPVKQIWDISINGGVLSWEIKLVVLDDIRISKKQILIYMSKDYDEWMDNYSRGIFPPDFNFDWQQMTFNHAYFIGLKSSNIKLPSVICEAESKDGQLLLIQNTNKSLCARVLKVELSDFEEYFQKGIYQLAVVKINITDGHKLAHLIGAIKENDQLTVDKLFGKKGRDGHCRIFAETEDLNNKIAGEGNWGKPAQLSHALKSRQSVDIGLSRYNFMSLNSLINYCLKQRGEFLDLRAVAPGLFPVNKLKENYISYLQRLIKLIEPLNIRLFLYDNELFDIIGKVSGQAYFYNEKDLLRLLGVISENSLIGPQTIVVDPYHRCNTNCVHCWIHTPAVKNSRVFLNTKMELQDYKSLIDDAAKLYVDEIIFQGAGEPLLDRRFAEMVCYAKQKGLKVIIFTNGTLLGAKMADFFVKAQVDEIFCSFPAGTAKTYKIVNSRLSEDIFYKTIKNLKQLVALRKKRKCEKPYLQMTHVIHTLNHHEIKQMAELDADIGADKTRFYLIRLDEHIKFLKLGLKDIETIKTDLAWAAPYLKNKNVELQDNITFQLKNYSCQTGNWSDRVFLERGCPVGWFFCMVLAKGEISMCCHMRTVEYMRNKSFEQIWRSPRYGMFRAAAKFLNENKNIKFANGMKLYDDFCGKCDTHQVILRIEEMLKRYRLDKYYKKADGGTYDAAGKIHTNS